VAEDVAKIDPDLVARDDQGKPYTVRYEAVNAMLLNEFLKEHRKVAEQDEEIAQLRTTVADLKCTIEKVSARLGAEKTTLRLVENR
jgi:trimeric autotransporter adhesin